MGVAFGWKLALAYAVAGVALGVVGGGALSLLRAERWLVPGATAPGGHAEDEEPPRGWRARVADAADTSVYILRKIAPWLVGALAGLPLYVSANAAVPLLEAFVAKGVPLGTALAFLLSAVGVSVPELVMLRAVMTPRLLAAFAGVVLVGTTIVGWLFNAPR